MRFSGCAKSLPQAGGIHTTYAPLDFLISFQLSPVSEPPSATPRPFGACEGLPAKEILRRVFYCPEGSKGFREGKKISNSHP